MNIVELIQKLQPGDLVTLFEVDLTVIGGTGKLYFHAGTDTLNFPIVWQGISYRPFPIQADGFEQSTRGTLPRPRLRAANVTGVLWALNFNYDDLVGAKVTRRRTFARYLDGQASADPTQYLPDDVFYVERKVSENRNMAEWELASALDLEAVKLPYRTITINSCPSEYRGTECSYTGNNFFDVHEGAVASLGLDVCSKTVNGCKARFPNGVPIPFGGFPAARAYRA